MDWLLVAARWVHFAATISLFGFFAFDRLVLRPTFAAAGAAPGGSRPPAHRLLWFAWTGLALTLISGGVWLLAVATMMSGQPFAVAVAHGASEMVLLRTRFGEDWLVRLGLAAGVAICLALRGARGAARAAAAGWAGLVLAGALLGALAWAGHGAATPGQVGRFHLAADILHLLAAGLWLGMLLPLASLLAEARRRGGARWAAIAGAATHRFSALAIGSVVVLLAGGIVNSSFLVGSLRALLGTEYGHLLLAKIGVFLGMAVIAAVNLLRLTPRLGRPAEEADERIWRAAAWLYRNALVEVALGLAVLAIVGALGILPPGTHGGPH